jgi:hypothetical protein
MSMIIENYSEKAIVVRGDTKEHKESLKQLGGKWNSNLKGGSGWIFSKSRENDVRNYISNPKPIAAPVVNNNEVAVLKRTVQTLQKQVTSLKERIDVLETLFEVEEEIEEEKQEVPKKRLLAHEDKLFKDLGVTE